MKQTQYSAALAVIGAFKGTNWLRLYEELELGESLSVKVVQAFASFLQSEEVAAPINLFDEITPEPAVAHNLRHQHVFKPMAASIVRSSNTCVQNVLSEWHSLHNNIKEFLTISELDRKLLAVISPKQRSIYNVYDRIGIQNLTKLRLQFSKINDHRFRHNHDCFIPR